MATWTLLIHLSTSTGNNNSSSNNNNINSASKDSAASADMTEDVAAAMASVSVRTNRVKGKVNSINDEVMGKWGSTGLASNLNFPPPIRIFQRHHGATSGADLDLDMAFEDDDCQFHVSEDIQVSRCFKHACI